MLRDDSDDGDDAMTAILPLRDSERCRSIRNGERGTPRMFASVFLCALCGKGFSLGFRFRTILAILLISVHQR
jgi:hypothetical protein